MYPKTNSMKKILILNTTLTKGGAAKVAYQLFKGLQTDFQMHFAYGRQRQAADKNIFYFGNRFETLLHVLLVRFFGLEGFGSYFSTKKIIRYIEKEKIDIVNIHNLHGYYINFFQLFSFVKKIISRLYIQCMMNGQ